MVKYGPYYTAGRSDEKLYIDLRRGRGYTRELERLQQLKKMRLRVVGYYQGEYMYSISNLGLLLSYYGIVEQNEMIALAA